LWQVLLASSRLLVHLLYLLPWLTVIAVVAELVAQSTLVISLSNVLLVSSLPADLAAAAMLLDQICMLS
jgi:hypothetical protein